MKSLQLIYRATVMIGTLVVGALAYRAYGPQLEKLQPVVGRLQQLAVQAVWPEEANDTLAAESLATDAPTPDNDLQPFDDVHRPAVSEAAVETPRVDPAVEPAGATSGEPMTSSTGQVETSPVAEVIAALSDRGVSEYALSRWGAEERLFRFRCSAPWGAEGRYAQHFEAVADDPQQAAQRVLDQVAKWQDRSADTAGR